MGEQTNGAERAKSLRECCDEMFMLWCRMRREAERAEPTEATLVAWRSEWERAYKVAEDHAKNPPLRDQFAQVRPVLLATMDFIVHTTATKVSNEKWDVLSRRVFGDGIYVDKATEHIEKELQSTDQSITWQDRLEIYLICVGLGFYTKYHRNPDKLADLRERLGERLSARMARDDVGRLCEQPYEVPANNADLSKKDDKVWLIATGVAAAVLALAALAGNAWTYQARRGELIKQITGQPENAPDKSVKASSVGEQP